MKASIVVGTFLLLITFMPGITLGEETGKLDEGNLPAVGNVDSAEAGQRIGTVEPGTESTESDELVAPGEGEEAVPASTGTWTVIGHESCWDVFGMSCTGSLPSPQSPQCKSGNSCSSLYSTCFDVSSSFSFFTELRCL